MGLALAAAQVERERRSLHANTFGVAATAGAETITWRLAARAAQVTGDDATLRALIEKNLRRQSHSEEEIARFVESIAAKRERVRAEPELVWMTQVQGLERDQADACLRSQKLRSESIVALAFAAALVLPTIIQALR